MLLAWVAQPGPLCLQSPLSTFFFQGVRSLGDSCWSIHVSDGLRFIYLIQPSQIPNKQQCDSHMLFLYSLLLHVLSKLQTQRDLLSKLRSTSTPVSTVQVSYSPRHRAIQGAPVLTSNRSALVERGRVVEGSWIAGRSSNLLDLVTVLVAPRRIT